MDHNRYIIEPLLEGPIQVCRIDVRTGAKHRAVLEPDASLDGQPPVVAAVAKAHWTKEMVKSWKAEQAALLASIPRAPESAPETA